MTTNHYIATLCLFGLPLATSWADNDTLLITPALYSFKYQEYNDANQLLDKEHGLLTGIKLGFAHTNNQALLETHIALLSGTIDYTGQTQSGTPHQTKTDESLINIGLRLLPRAEPDTTFALFLGFQYWQWDRNILTNNNVRGLHEIYSWNEMEAGLRIESLSKPQTLFWLEISALYSFNPVMEIQLDTSKEKLDLGELPGFRVRAGKTWTKNRTTTISFNLVAEYWSFGRSNTIFVNNFFGSAASITEPESETLNTGLEFIFTHAF